jgi:hypothetical protein
MKTNALTCGDPALDAAVFRHNARLAAAGGSLLEMRLMPAVRWARATLQAAGLSRYIAEPIDHLPGTRPKPGSPEDYARQILVEYRYATGETARGDFDFAMSRVIDIDRLFHKALGFYDLAQREAAKNKRLAKLNDSRSDEASLRHAQYRDNYYRLCARGVPEPQAKKETARKFGRNAKTIGRAVQRGVIHK